MRKLYTLTFLSFLVSFFFSTIKADILYVKPGAGSPAWQGKTNVYSDLKTALADAVAGDEVWVAAGIYKPTNDGDRNISFELKDGVHYYGGFVGDEIELSERDWQLNETILSGDIGVEGDNKDNSYHVLVAKGTESSAITNKTRLDGFIIEKGCANDYLPSDSYGGGFYLKYASPLILNCYFRNNYASSDGGAVYGDYFSDVKFGNVIFSSNSARGEGGGVYSNFFALEFYSCVWYDNHSGYRGSAVRGNFAKVYNSIAWNNSVVYKDDDFYGTYIFNSIFERGSSDNHNISSDPQFIDPGSGDFRLRAGSPSLNTGDNEKVPEWLATDYFGAERIQNGVVDMGVSEGGVVTPILVSPSDSTMFESDHANVLLEWGWSDTQPADVEHYILEYSINGGEPVSVENQENLSYSLTGLNPASVVQWRVASVNASGVENWSELYWFVVLRGHPLHVTPEGKGTGSSWSDAMDLQTAIDLSIDVDSIWVAKGVYYPTNTTDKNVSFELKDYVKIFGGFAGDETTFSERNRVANETILSGNIGDKEVKTDNSINVVTALGTVKKPISINTVLDGFIIEDGYARNNRGGGMVLDRTSMIVRNVWFRDNFATRDGGAVYINYDCSPKFGNVLFTANSSSYNGGAVFVSNSAEFYNCTWHGNTAGGRGGSVYGSAIITNSISWGNYSGVYDNEFSSSNIVRNSIYETRDETNGNVSADPMFVAPDKNDFRLLAGSPGVNTGTNEDVPEWLTTDWNGFDRIQEDTVDVGFSEGAVLAPVLLSPANKTYFENGTGSVLLEWGWNESQPSDVESYAVEFTIDQEEPLLMEDIQGMNYTLAGLESGSVVSWCVCSVDENGRKTWSKKFNFSILRGHPLYVTPDGTGTGSSWTDAMSLKEALENAVDGDSIWVAKGVYKPTTTIDRNISFELTKNIRMFGGFGGNETEFSQRNHIINETILSGDIGEKGVYTDNSYHVLSAVGTTKEPDDWSAVVDGFTIEDGYSNDNGGGLYLKWASPVFVNIHFRNNYASNYGGAVYDDIGSQAEFGNVLFTGNSSGELGGAVYANKLLKYYNCVWFNNSSNYVGGAAYGRNKIVNSIFWKNSTENNHNNDLNYDDLVSYTIYDNGNSNNNFSGNPEFIDAENGDFRIKEESIALNAGSKDVIPEWLTTDYLGNSRILEDTIDIGLFEGEIVVPNLLTPEDQSVFTIEEGASVNLTWEIKDSDVAATISDFLLEYIMAEDTILIENIADYEYKLSDMAPLDVVNWRVGYDDESGYTNWSAYAIFSFYRGHPLFVIPGGTGDGSSWENGIDLKGALSMAVRADSLWISRGTYKPSFTGRRYSSFVINKNVKLFGGFSGVETDFEERNIYKNQVVLSGDIGEIGVASDNSYHVVKITGSLDHPVTEMMVLDGVTIEGGYGDGIGYSDGGGLYIDGAFPIIKNVRFRNNYASYNGGAVYGDPQSRAEFGNVIFINNESGHDGGAVYSHSNFKFYNCVWYNNYSGFLGGAAYGNMSVINSIAWNNFNSFRNNDFYGNYTCNNSIYLKASNSNGNISEDPAFMDAENSDFRLREESPAINNGNTEAAPAWLTEDYFGNTRILEDTIDIGSVEGFVIVPELESPEDGSVYSNSEVVLDWSLDPSVAENVSDYKLEYIVNNTDTTLIENISEQQFTLNNASPADFIQWRVAYVDDNEFINWSSRSSFTIYRGHPLYVVPDGPGDGSSWADATNLQDALHMSIVGDSIWIAAGTYKPTSTTDRNISFEIKDNVKLFGGFAGTESSFSERNLVKNKTILSGDIGEVGVDTDNSYHVVQMRGTEAVPITQNTVMDGVVIEKGYGDEHSAMDGGGLLLEKASPVVRNVWFRDNYTLNEGAAVYGGFYSDASFGNVIFVDNESQYNGGAIVGYGNMEIFNCVMYKNYAAGVGGAVYGSGVTVTNSIAWGNTAGVSYDDFDYNCTVTNSIYSGYGNSDGNNLSQNPLFVDAEAFDFRLQEGSPAINAGNTEILPDWLTHDYCGVPRIQKDTVDMGAFEGEVIIPILVSPADKSNFEADASTVLLKWGWKESAPDNVNDFVVEYTINEGEPQLIDNISGLETQLTGLHPADIVSWRVGSLENTGFTNWTEHITFTVNRDHPIYVKPGAAGNGSSWLDAMDLKDALEMSIPNDEIWVAEGVYKPVDTLGDRSSSFSLKNGVKLYGGFGGFESSVDERDWLENETILSGDIGVTNVMNDNVYNVVTISGTEKLPLKGNVLDGFIIEKGNARYHGGGVYISRAAPELRNLWLKDNHAETWGGAIYIKEGSNPVFSNVLFVNNSAGSDGGAVMASSDATFNSCLWYGNETPYIGGAIFKYWNAEVQVYNSIAWNNEASTCDDFNFSGSLQHCLFAGADDSDGNISEDPMFVDASNNFFQLQKGSPAINAGDNALVPENLSTDISGFDRIYGKTVDIGPFEHVHIEHISPLNGGSGTKDFSMLMMLDLVWGITDGTMVPQTEIPSGFNYQLRLWEAGDEENMLENGPFTAHSGIEGSNNSTTIGNLEFGTAYQWSIGLDYGNYVVWSEPTTFYIGHDHTIKVKEGSTGTTGVSWDDAFGTLHEAIDYALPADEIWVAAGTYYPVTPADPDNVTRAEREQALVLKPGLIIYGGLAGNESNARDRNHVENPVVLSGDIGIAGDDSDNSVNLIRNEYDATTPLNAGTLIEGFIFEDATETAMYNVNASPSVEYSVFRNNNGVYGGAVYNENSSPKFFNVLFHDNEASQEGGAIFADVDSHPELLSCTVADNIATNTGGLSGNYDVRNSIVYGNENGQFSDMQSIVLYSCVEGGYNGEENISYNPQWSDPENDDYTLQEFSPCIDQGNQSYFEDLFSYDLAKKARTHWLETDMGAFEVQEIGTLEVVESSIVTDGLTDFIDSITIQFNQPIAVDESILPTFTPDVEVTCNVSHEDSTLLVITHPGLEASKDYYLELPEGMIFHANNEMIIRSLLAYNFVTRACVPVSLTAQNANVEVCPRTSVVLEAAIEGDVLDYVWVFNSQDTLITNVDSVSIESVVTENTGVYTLKATDWCGSSDETTINLQFKEMTDLVIPEPKWESVYFVDNISGNFSNFKWYADGEQVSEKQYLNLASQDGSEFVVTALDEVSQCVVYSDTINYSGSGLKSAIVTPNPVQSGNAVTIRLPEISEKSRIRLYDMKGRLLVDQAWGESDLLKLEKTQFKPGVYLLRIEYVDERLEERKLLIKE
ncbi:choice-of-anchor Q domain-containing protein [Anaerophaga thermohalophila]|uniref:choice-of-anchor Q domain-containing protein n=1 Tax=Anaerophaga thermohalophila TaxID=177400 RepID=UPI0002D913A7|nr:choice-of-anchor Q domain-containing protein [Anaerophaga thermohalophila]